MAKFLAKEHKYASIAKVSTSTNGMYEVRHGLDLHRVCLKEYICTCKKWQICGIPCEHTKKQPKAKKRIMHCGVCGMADHNSRHHKNDKVLGHSLYVCGCCCVGLY